MLILILYSCNSNRPNRKAIIKVNNLGISFYEYDRELNRFNSNDIDLYHWKIEYLENSFFICDAIELGYDTIKSINEKVNGASNLMMVQKYGYLWKETVSPIVDEFMEVTDEKAQKREKLFYFDCLKFNNYNSRYEISSIQSLEEYNQFKSRCGIDENISTSYSTMQWPFSLFYSHNDELYNMTPGDISTPIRFKDDLFVFYLDHVENIEVLESDKKQLSSLLQKIKEDEIDEAKTEEMLKKGNPVIYYESIKELIRFLEDGNSIYDYKGNPELLSYKLNNKDYRIDFSSYLQKLSNSIFKPVFKDSIKLVESIYQYYYNEYLEEEACRLGVYDEEKFLLDKRNFKNKLLLSHYMKVKFSRLIKIDSTEISNYYLQNKSSFTVNEGIEVYEFSFDSKEEANKYLKEQTEKEIKYQRNWDSNDSYIVDLANNQFTEDQKTELKNLPNNTTLNKVIENRDEFIVLYKICNVNNQVRDYEDVVREIEHILYSNKFKELRSNKLKDLKNKYPLLINKTGVEI